MNLRFRERPQSDEYRTAAQNRTKRGQRRPAVSECFGKLFGDRGQNGDDIPDAPVHPPKINRPVKQSSVNAGFFGQCVEIGGRQHFACRFGRRFASRMFASRIPGVRFNHEDNFFDIGKRPGKPG